MRMREEQREREREKGKQEGNMWIESCVVFVCAFVTQEVTNRGIKCSCVSRLERGASLKSKAKFTVDIE